MSFKLWPNGRPVVKVGDVLRTERGRVVHVDRIVRLPDAVSAVTHGRPVFDYIDEGTGGSVSDVAVVSVYRRPGWVRP